MLVLVPLQSFIYTEDGIKRLSLAIQATLLQNGWSHRELAKKAGIAHGTVNRYIKPTVIHPQEDVLKSIAPYIYKVVSINHNAVEIDPSTTYADDWSNLAKIATDEFQQQNLYKMETLRELIINEIKRLEIAQEDFAKLVKLSPSVLEEILNGDLPGNKDNKLSKLAPRLTNPLTNRKFIDSEELAEYCGLIKNPAQLEQENICHNHLPNGV